MDCQQTQFLADAFVDDELDLLRELEFTAHLKECPACAELVETRRMLKSATAAPELYAAAPAGLRARLQSALRAEGDATFAMTQRQLKPGAALHFATSPWRWMAVAASLLLVVGIAGLIAVRSVGPNESLARDVVAGHVRSLAMETHLFDVLSSDQHTVKPWFAGKIDYSPPVKDLADHGFKLAGGRLDYLDNRAVAALVYRRGRHVINLFVWPTSSADSSIRAEDLNGYHLLHWSHGAMSYWAVSDLNERELREFGGFLIDEQPTQRSSTER